MFDYYYGNESEQFKFLRIPKVLFTEKELFGSLSNDAKILYAFLHERMTLSRQNGWVDDENRVYIIFTVDEVCDVMNCSIPKAVRLLQELDEYKGIGLIEKKRRGQGKTTIIYVKNFVGADTANSECSEKEASDVENISENPPDFKNDELLNLKNDNSRIPKIQSQDFTKFKANNINISNTDLSYIDFNQSTDPAREEKFLTDGLIERETIEKQVCEAIEYEHLYPDDETLHGMVTEMKDIIVDVMCGNRKVVVGKKEIPAEAAKSAYGKLRSEHIVSALRNVLNYPERISKIDNFIAAVLYNVAYTENLSTFTGFTAATGIKLIE